MRFIPSCNKISTHCHSSPRKSLRNSTKFTNTTINNLVSHLVEQLVSNFDKQHAPKILKRIYTKCTPDQAINAITVYHKLVAKASPIDTKCHRNGNFMEEFTLAVLVADKVIDEGKLNGASISHTRGDGGIDIIASKKKRSVIIECKNWCNDISKNVIEKLASNQADIRIVAAFGSFSNVAIESAKYHKVRLYDQYKLFEMFLNNIDDTLVNLRKINEFGCLYRS